MQLYHSAYYSPPFHRTTIFYEKQMKMKGTSIQFTYILYIKYNIGTVITSITTVYIWITNGYNLTFYYKKTSTESKSNNSKIEKRFRRTTKKQQDYIKNTLNHRDEILTTTLRKMWGS